MTSEKELKRLADIRREICGLADETYREFQSRLLPEHENLAGVRLPLLRRLAKRLANEGGASYLESALRRKPEEELFEEIMLQGMVIGYMKADISDLFVYADRFIPKIDNWSVCDSFCSGFKHALAYPVQTWNWLLGYINSDQEFGIRFGVVMLLNYYVDSRHLEELFAIFNSIRHEGYYVRMAVAWAVSICYVKYPVECMVFLNGNKLDTATYNKALQKITESHCVGREEKDRIRRMKRKDGDGK